MIHETLPETLRALLPVVPPALVCPPTTTDSIVTIAERLNAEYSAERAGER